MSTMKDIISSPLLLALVIIGLLYIVGFSLVYLKKHIHTVLSLEFLNQISRMLLNQVLYFQLYQVFL